MSRILFLVPRMNMGGAETYVYTVAQELHSRGEHEVFVASAGGKLSDKLAALGVKTFFIPVRFSRKISLFLLKHIVDKYNIDIVHANSGAAGVVAAMLKNEIDVKVVYTAHGIFGNIEREHIINSVDKIICVSNYVKERALEQSFDENKLITKYCGVDTKRFKPEAILRNKLRVAYSVSDRTLVLITVSRIKNYDHKGHNALVEMFSKYAKYDDWKLFVIGKGNALPKLRFEIAKAKLQDKIICLGHRTDVENLLNISDIYVSPTRFETFGLSIAEGMSMGRPAVAYAVGGTPEVISDGVSGLLVKYRDVKDLYDKIKYLDENRDVLEKMGLQARALIKKRFSNEKMVDGLEQIYKDILSK